MGAYPNCHIEHDGFGDWRDRIGDGVCDGYDYNTAECGWDGGDCDAVNAVLWETYPKCNGGIAPELIGDGYCHGNEMSGGDMNIAECGWEGGDCVVIGYPDCHVEYPNNIGDGDCVDRNDEYGYNTRAETALHIITQPSPRLVWCRDCAQERQRSLWWRPRYYCAS